MTPHLVGRMPGDALPPLPQEPRRVFERTGFELPIAKSGVESDCTGVGAILPGLKGNKRAFTVGTVFGVVAAAL